MRAQLNKTISRLFLKNKKMFLVLGDIGVYGFKDLLESKRAVNIGILEQATISFASGLSKIGFIPVVHTIATFMISRAFEQLKLDFGYNQLNGNFISVGASYDYAALGCSHHCPEDINLLKNIPNMQIIVPGNSYEFDKLFSECYTKNNPKYFRLSSEENKLKCEVKFGKGIILNQGEKVTVIAVGPVLNIAYEICKKLNVNLVYYTSIRPFDKKILKKLKIKTTKILIIEPFYSGSIIKEVIDSFGDIKVKIDNISVPFKFLTNYGSKKQHDEKLGFNKKNIEFKLQKLIKSKF
jgi:transketolase